MTALFRDTSLAYICRTWFTGHIAINGHFGQADFGQASILKRYVPDIAPLPGVHVSTIATKTGTDDANESNARVVVEICDSQGTCCQTSSDGLDNPGQDRRKGQTDVYTNQAILDNCAQEVIHILTLGQ